MSAEKIILRKIQWYKTRKVPAGYFRIELRLLNKLLREVRS